MQRGGNSIIFLFLKTVGGRVFGKERENVTVWFVK